MAMASKVGTLPQLLLEEECSSSDSLFLNFFMASGMKIFMRLCPPGEGYAWYQCTVPHSLRQRAFIKRRNRSQNVMLPSLGIVFSEPQIRYHSRQGRIPVDQTIIDGGNEWYKNTESRTCLTAH
ncbi:hypothetical protein MRB53_006193 [Persea americana]|uniref:Uncharacterized protein n=1 Tax=Persea americana TaxID=3435 RepID=A0ACC2MFM8_PERAE|nr:hypothetical protein MRB53_006193 [Persea americana]